MWRCHLFDYITYIPFCVHWHGDLFLRLILLSITDIYFLFTHRCLFDTRFQFTYSTSPYLIFDLVNVPVKRIYANPLMRGRHLIPILEHLRRQVIDSTFLNMYWRGGETLSNQIINFISRNCCKRKVIPVHTKKVVSSVHISLSLFVCLYTHTHTHTHIYIYMSKLNIFSFYLSQFISPSLCLSLYQSIYPSLYIYIYENSTDFRS